MAKIKGKKGGTPEHLDEVLRLREIIGEEEYTEFWRGFNRLRGLQDREEYTDQWLSERFAEEGEPIEEEVAEEPVEHPIIAPKRVKRIVRASKGWAVRDAKKFGGRVIRVDRNGKRNRRGRHWKAVKR